MTDCRFSTRECMRLLVLVTVGVCILTVYNRTLWSEIIKIVPCHLRMPDGDRCKADNLCVYGKPCMYDDEVDLRIIIMVFDRAASLRKVLNSVSKLELDGDEASVEIWIDVREPGKGDNGTIKVASKFSWNGKRANVHIQEKHAGIYGQWINSWKPRENSRELAILLEDDVDLSPFAYRWLKAASSFYKYRVDIGGISLYEGAIINWKTFPPDLTFYHRRLGTQGFAPNPTHWRKFQDWYHRFKSDPKFHPYVKDDPVTTGWYKNFEKRKKEDSMWEMWYIWYADKHKLWTLFSNICAHHNAQDSSVCEDKFLAYHRQASGLHFSGMERDSKDKLIQSWLKQYLNFSEQIPHFSYANKQIDVIPRTRGDSGLSFWNG